MYKNLRIIFVSTLLFLSCFSGVHALSDSDTDSIADAIDKCPNTQAWKIPDSIGCTEEQRTKISFPQMPNGNPNTLPDYNNPDIDFDGISNDEEVAGYTGTALYMLGTHIQTNPYSPDTDDDGLGDSEEKIAGTDPRTSDTDSDGITDDIDEEKLTPVENRRHVDATWKFNPEEYSKRDDDKDGIPDEGEIACQYSKIGAEVFPDGEYKWCSQAQRTALIDLKSAQGKFAALPSGTSSGPLYDTTKKAVDQAIQQRDNSRAQSLSDLFKVTTWPLSIGFSDGNSDLNIRADAKNGAVRPGYIEDFKSEFGSYFFGGDLTGEKGAKNLMLTIARDVKNIMVLIAIIYLFIMVMRLIFSGGSDEDVKKWRSGILYAALGIIVMQISYVLVATLYDQKVTGATAQDLLEKVVYPLVRMLELLASFAFLAMAFFAFYQIVTAGGVEEKAKKGKQTIIFALIGFILLKIPKVLVETIYGKAECTDRFLGLCRVTISDPNLSGTVQIMTKLINYFNGFIGLVTVLLVIYAGFLVITGGGDEEKVKKAKSIITYAIIGIALLIASYALFNFFVASGKPVTG